MIRSLYFIGGLFAMAIILFAQRVDLTSSPHAGVAVQDRASATVAAAAPDPADTALDDLAAWPVAAGR